MRGRADQTGGPAEGRLALGWAGAWGGIGNTTLILPKRVSGTLNRPLHYCEGIARLK